MAVLSLWSLSVLTRGEDCAGRELEGGGCSCAAAAVAVCLTVDGRRSSGVASSSGGRSRVSGRSGGSSVGALLFDACTSPPAS
jgi:hypothetical protein